MGKSYIDNINHEYLNHIGIDKKQMDNIKRYINIAIANHLYTNTKDFQHDLKHIERVLMYEQLIINEKAKHYEIVNDQEVLFLATIYHDCGLTTGANREEHGRVSAEYFKKKMTSILDPVTIEKITRLIETHASEEDMIQASHPEINKFELQMLSNILKDADALDRNRLNLPPPIGNCDPSKLRCPESAEVLKESGNLLKEYMRAMIYQNTNNSALEELVNEQKVREWLDQYKNGNRDYLYHASLTPGIEVLEPKESTQKGSYVYAGEDPVDCSTMAMFHSSLLFPRITRETKTINGSKEIVTKKELHGILEIFKGSTKDILKNKYITLYQLNKNDFTPYEAEVTAAPRGEWISSKPVQVQDSVSIPTDKYLTILREKNLLTVEEVSYINREKEILKSSRKSMEMLFWDVKKSHDDPHVFDNHIRLTNVIIAHYAPEYADQIIEYENRAKGIIARYRINHPDMDTNDESHIRNMIDEYRNSFLVEQKEKTNTKEKQDQVFKRTNGYLIPILYVLFTISCGVFLAYILLK